MTQPPTGNGKHRTGLPLVRVGQGEYARDLYPRDLDDPPRPSEGACVGVLLIALFYFVLGLLIGAWLW